MVTPNNSRISKSNIKVLKFLTSVFCYLFIMVGSILIIHFANKRGNPMPLIVLYYVALGIIILLIALCIVKFFVQQLGHYHSIFDLLEKILAIIWESVVFTSFVLACILFEAFRWDYLFITIVQGLAVFLMLFYSKTIDFRINKKFNSKIQKAGDGNARESAMLKRREVLKSMLCFSVSILIFVIQAVVLVLPMLPPKIDNIFSQDRTLKYTYYKNVRGYDDGYYVAGVYFGINDSIKIPLSYNNVPIVGILSDSISDIGTINKIQLGEYDSNGILQSNIKLIEKDAIVLNKIKILDLPESLKTMGDNAISGSSFETVNYYSVSAFSLSSFDMDNLKTLNIKNTTEAVNIDYGDANIKVNVPVDLYNVYREQFFENRRIFNISNDNIIVIDFETETDYYLNSQILEKNNGQIDISSLKNADEETSTLIKDTVQYNANNYTCEGFVSREGYAFRGWYRDSEYTLECSFNDFGKVFFSTSTTVYAKWEVIKTAELDWSNYYPRNEAKTMIRFVSSLDLEESIMFPKLVENGGDIKRIGFVALVWKCGNTTVEKTADLFDIADVFIQIKAEWQLEKATISYETKVNDVDYTGSNLTFVFDENQIINYSATFSHVSDEVDITYNWWKLDSSGNQVLLKTATTTNNDKFNYSLRNFNESGIYKFETIAVANTGEVAYSFRNYTINIKKKDLDASQYKETAPVVRTYDGNSQELMYAHAIPSTEKVMSTYEAENGYSAVAPVMARGEAYIVRFVFEKIDEEADNYNAAYLYSSIMINPKPVTAIWTQSDISWDINFRRIYDGIKHNLIPLVDGICNTDNVNFVLSNPAQSNVGIHTSNIIGIDNPNYIIDTENTVFSHVWEITPKTISAVWGEKVKQYEGTNVNFELILSGIVESDKFSITSKDFTVSTLCSTSYDQNNDMLLFSARDIGTYNVLLSAFNNANYSFSSVADLITITAATLSVSWEDMAAEFNGTVQNAKLIISGFKAGDEELYNEKTLREKIIINANCDYSILSQTEGKLVIGFAGRNAASYDIYLQKIVNDNYLLYSDSNTFVISPQNLSGVWSISPLIYNGAEQKIMYKIQGVYNEDAARMLAEDFTTNINCIRYDIAHENDCVSINFYAMDAGTYLVSVKNFNTNRFGDNYTFSDEANASFIISPRAVSVTWDNESFIYDGNLRSVYAVINNKCKDDVVNLTYSNNQAVNVGHYVATVAVDNANYTADSTSYNKWQISKKFVSVSSSGTEMIYNGKYKYFDISYTGFVQKDLTALAHTDFTYSNNHDNRISYSYSGIINDKYTVTFKAIDAKDYIITLLYTTLDNYEIESKDVVFSITPLKIEYNWDYKGNLIYNQKEQMVLPIFTNLCKRVDTDEFDTVSSVVSNSTMIDAGTYIAKLDSVLSTNYYVDISTNTLEWSIQKKKLSASWNNPTLIFSASHQQNTAIAVGTCGSDVINFEYTYFAQNAQGEYVSASSTVNRGNYKALVVGFFGSNSSNYTLGSEEISAEYEIFAKTLTVTLVGNDYTYDSKIKDGAVMTFSGFPSSAEVANFELNDFDYYSDATLYRKVNLTLSSCAFSFGAINVGSFYTILNGSQNSNYVFDNCSATFAVLPRVANISWSTATYTYDGTNKTFEAFISNKLAGDTINIQYVFEGVSVLGNNITSNSMKDAGEYIVRIISIDNKNYTIEGLSNAVADGILAKKFTINKKALGISYAGLSNVYNGDYQATTLTITGYIANDKAMFANNPLIYSHNGCIDRDIYANQVLSLFAVNAGTYQVTIVDLNSSFANSNYCLDSTYKKEVNYTISKATISVIWSGSSLEYNGYAQKITATISSPIYTNKLSNLKDVINLTYTNNSAVDSATYIATLASISNDNYQLPVTKTCSWTIKKKTLLLSWNAETGVVYDGKYHFASLTIDNFVASDVPSKTSSSFSGTVGSMSISNISASGNSVTLHFRNIDAGTYRYQLSSISDPNYTFAASQNSMTIGKRTAELSWSANTVFVYDGLPHAISCSVSNLYTRADTGLNDIANVILSNYSKTNAGEYTATASSISNTNYLLPTQTAKSWQINKVLLYSTWSSGSEFAYSGSSYTATLTISNFVNGEHVNVKKADFSVNTSVFGFRTVDNKICLDFSNISAGTYEYNVISYSNANYILQSTPKTIVINKVALTSNWSSDSSYVYSGNANIIQLSISGFVNSDENITTLSAFNYAFTDGLTSITPVLSRNGGVLILTFSLTNAGDYALKVSAFVGINYSFTSTVKNIKIAKKVLTISWTGINTFTYNGENQGMHMFVDGLASKDISTFSNYINIVGSYSITYTSSRVTIAFGARDVGTYNINVSAKSTLQNYSFASQSKSFSIVSNN